jgi:hypothetical protein
LANEKPPTQMVNRRSIIQDVDQNLKEKKNFAVNFSFGGEPKKDRKNSLVMKTEFSDILKQGLSDGNVFTP